jgi:alpha-galactosidase
MRNITSVFSIWTCIATALFCVPGLCTGQGIVTVSSDHISLEFDQFMRSRVVSRFGDTPIALDDMQDSEVLLVNGQEVGQFVVKSQSMVDTQASLGLAHRLVLIGTSGAIRKTVTVDSYRSWPDMLFINVEYRNTGPTNLNISGWVNGRHSLRAGTNGSTTAFWSLQNGSYEKRPDWVLPVKAPFHQENYLGMNASDYGGGTPVIDVWRPDVGLALGHDELSPKLVSFPVDMQTDDSATMSMKYLHPRILKAGESLKTLETFIEIHQGDYFRALVNYRKLMISRGVRFPDAPAGGFDPIWCAWGFGRNFRPEQIVNALPTVKKLGFKWVTMDDGWQTAEGDWALNPAKFPHGDADIRALVDKIHAAGFRAQLWWAPMSVSPKSHLFAEHPDWMLLDPEGQRRKISWWNSYYLCPAYPQVVKLHQQMAQKAIGDWGFDGLKIDGQFLNAVPPCTHPAHKHHSPEDSVEAVPLFFKAISEAVKAVKPDALIELCPCGTAYSFYSMPYFNMSVASDPENSFQVRSKGKTLKALMGDGLPYFGDHIEMSDGGMDFASTVGVGGVIGTDFRWPPDDDKASPPSDTDAAKLRLTPAKEAIWAEWVRIYADKMLSKGEYLGGLYDIGFDKPETHAIRKNRSMYYGLYAPHWQGSVELRGLSSAHYRVTDYEHHRDLGTVRGPTARLSVSFDQHLLIEANPEAGQAVR